MASFKQIVYLFAACQLSFNIINASTNNDEVFVESKNQENETENNEKETEKEKELQTKE